MITRTTRPGDLPEWLNVDETAAWLDCSTSTIYAMVQRGQLHAARLGRLLRISKESLVALAKRQR